MAEMTQSTGAGLDKALRGLFWTCAALMLASPLIAMQFTREVDWTASDFIFAWLLFAVAGSIFELTMRKTRSWTQRFAAGFAVAAGFLIIWANAAVGMIGSEDNSYNLLFIGVIGLVLAGSIVARFRSSGMALAMLAAGIVHAAVALYGMAADPQGGIFSLAFAGLWLLSAALFRKAAMDGTQAA